MVANRGDRFRPSWRVKAPSGQELTAEYDRLRGLWRVTPGEYVRRQLADALAQATGYPVDVAWITAFEQQIDLERVRG
jgi:uncharacterized protein (DUF2336 family)